MWSTPSLPLLPGLLLLIVVLPIRVPSMGQIHLFENDSYSIGPFGKKILLRNSYTKNVYMFCMNVIPEPLNLRLVDIPLNQSIHQMLLTSKCFGLLVQTININTLLRLQLYTCLNEVKNKFWIKNMIVYHVWLVSFYGISTIISNLKPNPICTYILNI